MKEKSFTLVELLITLVIFAILVSFAFGAYAKMVENARENTCIQNQLLIKTLLDNFITEKNAAPAGLAAIPDEYFIKALAKVEKENPGFIEKLRFYAKIINPLSGSIAYAAFTEDDYLAKAMGIKSEFLICPMDKNFKKPTDPNIPYTGYYSYAMNLGLSSYGTMGSCSNNDARCKWQYALDNNELITLDCVAPYFNATSQVALRHTHLLGTANGIGMLASGKAKKFKQGGFEMAAIQSQQTTQYVMADSSKSGPQSQTSKTTWLEELIEQAASIFNGIMSGIEKGIEMVFGKSNKSMHIFA